MRKALQELEDLYGQAELMEMSQDSVVPSICIKCLEEGDGVEPDAMDYTCQSCGNKSVYSSMMLYMLTI